MRLLDKRNKVDIVTCPHCRRPGWERVTQPFLVTPEEHKDAGFISKLNSLSDDPGDITCMALLGGSIYECVKEAIELANQLDKRILFEFNGKTVAVSKYSDVDLVVRKWWVEMYGKTPEESFRDDR